MREREGCVAAMVVNRALATISCALSLVAQDAYAFESFENTTTEITTGGCLFQGSNQVMEPTGPGRTCQEIIEMYPQFNQLSMETCYSHVTFQPQGMSGAMDMPFFQFQEYLYGAGGCCGDEWTFECEQYIQYGECPEEYCPPATAGGNATCYEVIPDEAGRCAPCYGTVIKGDFYSKDWCAQCHELDTSGCGEEQCVESIGVWKSWSKECEACNHYNATGCEEDKCTEMGHKYVQEWDRGRCQMCDPTLGRVEGCEENQCVGEGVHWVCYYGHCECKICDPEAGDHRGCPEEHCDGDGMFWKCRDVARNNCFCELCDPTGRDNWPGVCPEDMCHHPEAPDAKWIEYRWGGGRCSRCTDQDWISASDGCFSREECEDVGFDWTCQHTNESMGEGCCSVCHDQQVWGCRTEESCKEHEGNWVCNNWGCNCQPCVPEHDVVWGCREHECSAEHDHYWKCDSEDNCSCQTCDLRYPHGCPEHRCLAEDMNFWVCLYDGCECQKCDFRSRNGGWIGNCPQDLCEASEDASWVTWNEWQWNYTAQQYEEVEFSSCRGCFLQGPWHYETGGCQTRQRCENVEGFSWACDNETDDGTSHCCQICTEENVWGCAQDFQCIGVGGNWCGNYCTSHECPWTTTRTTEESTTTSEPTTTSETTTSETTFRPPYGTCRRLLPGEKALFHEKGFQLSFC